MKLTCANATLNFSYIIVSHKRRIVKSLVRSQCPSTESAKVDRSVVEVCSVPFPRKAVETRYSCPRSFDRMQRLKEV